MTAQLIWIAVSAICFADTTCGPSLITRAAYLSPLRGGGLSANLDSANILAARLALLAIRGSLNESVSVDLDRMILEPNEEVIPIGRVAEKLAHLPKPVECSGRADRGVMRISCRALESRNDILKQQVVAWALAREGVIPSMAESDMVLIRSREEKLLMPWGVFQTWLETYSVPVNLAFTSRQPNNDERILGALVVVVVGRAEPVDVDSALDRFNLR